MFAKQTLKGVPLLREEIDILTDIKIQYDYSIFRHTKSTFSSQLVHRKCASKFGKNAETAAPILSEPYNKTTSQKRKKPLDILAARVYNKSVKRLCSKRLPSKLS